VERYLIHFGPPGEGNLPRDHTNSWNSIFRDTITRPGITNHYS